MSKAKGSLDETGASHDADSDEDAAKPACTKAPKISPTSLQVKFANVRSKLIGLRSVQYICAEAN
jgi:hypothetical protein